MSELTGPGVSTCERHKSRASRQKSGRRRPMRRQSGFLAGNGERGPNLTAIFHPPVFPHGLHEFCTATACARYNHSPPPAWIERISSSSLSSSKTVAPPEKMTMRRPAALQNDVFQTLAVNGVLSMYRGLIHWV